MKELQAFDQALLQVSSIFNQMIRPLQQDTGSRCGRTTQIAPSWKRWGRQPSKQFRACSFSDSKWTRNTGPACAQDDQANIVKDFSKKKVKKWLTKKLDVLELSRKPQSASTPSVCRILPAMR
jgi:hypothetical protein